LEGGPPVFANGHKLDVEEEPPSSYRAPDRRQLRGSRHNAVAVAVTNYF
jgi:hypothetical protein